MRLAVHYAADFFGFDPTGRSGAVSFDVVASEGGMSFALGSGWCLSKRMSPLSLS